MNSSLSKTCPRCLITLNHVVQTQLEFFLYSFTFLILKWAYSFYYYK